jgi:copper chaperone CopZ
MKTQFNVEKMMCGGCSANVEKALVGAIGVKAVDIDLEKKTVTIIGDIDAPAIATLISAAGYPATVT